MFGQRIEYNLGRPACGTKLRGSIVNLDAIPQHDVDAGNIGYAGTNTGQFSNGCLGWRGHFSAHGNRHDGELLGTDGNQNDGELSDASANRCVYACRATCFNQYTNYGAVANIYANCGALPDSNEYRDCGAFSDTWARERQWA